MKIVKLSKLDSLKGLPPRAVYDLAKELKFQVRILDGPMPAELFYKTLYFRVNEDEALETIWCHENHIEFDSL